MSQTESQNLALADAFEAFNRHSSQLEASYAALQGQVRDLTVALARSHDARLAELTEKECIAARLTELLEALPAAVVVVDAGGAVTDYNTRAGNLFGAGLDAAAWSRVAAERFARFSGEDGEFRLREGGWLALSRRPIPGSDSQILLFTDITESKRLRESLQRRQRLSMLGEMAARLAHQIRTPLSAALLYASQIRMRSPDAFTDDCAARIEGRLRDLEAMVQDMLAFAGGTPTDEEFIDVRGLLDGVAETAGAELPDHLRIAVVQPAGDLSLQGNRAALAGALLNLVSNAIQHSRDAGVITLGAAQSDDGEIELYVRDQGCGVSEAHRQTIFEPFFTTRARGTGLGLAVVRSVAKAHGGDVSLQTSERGSTFAMRLPATTPFTASVTAGRDARLHREEACHG